MKNIKQILIAIFFLSFIQTILRAQEIHRSQEGTITITMDYNDTVLIARSHHLMVMLNYETGHVSFKAPYESFRTFIYRYQSDKAGNQQMEFKGKLVIPYINIKRILRKIFDVEGTCSLLFRLQMSKQKGHAYAYLFRRNYLLCADD